MKVVSTLKLLVRSLVLLRRKEDPLRESCLPQGRTDFAVEQIFDEHECNMICLHMNNLQLPRSGSCKSYQQYLKPKYEFFSFGNRSCLNILSTQEVLK